LSDISVHPFFLFMSLILSIDWPSTKSTIPKIFAMFQLVEVDFFLSKLLL